MDDHTTRRRWLPNSTQIPNHFLDWVMQDLTESEMKVAFYILRRTFGFQKDGDRISLSQLVDGITRRDGRQLDRGTGLARSSVVRGIKGLEGRGLLQVHRTPGTKQNSPETTYYSLMIEDVGDSPKLQPPQSQIEPGDSARLSPGAVPNSNGQDQDQDQETKQEKQIAAKRKILARLTSPWEADRRYNHLREYDAPPETILAGLEAAIYEAKRAGRR